MDKTKLRISVLKELANDNRPEASDYGIDDTEYAKIIRQLQVEGLIDGSKEKRYIDETRRANLTNAIVTIKGEEYIKENSILAKTYKGLKEVKDWLI